MCETHKGVGEQDTRLSCIPEIHYGCLFLSSPSNPSVTFAFFSGIFSQYPHFKSTIKIPEKHQCICSNELLFTRGKLASLIDNSWQVCAFVSVGARLAAAGGEFPAVGLRGRWNKNLLVKGRGLNVCVNEKLRREEDVI